jgi:hypothetical protein
MFRQLLDVHDCFKDAAGQDIFFVRLASSYKSHMTFRVNSVIDTVIDNAIQL